MINKAILSILFFHLCMPLLRAQNSSEKVVYQQIMKMDSILFEEGFNKCNFKELNRITAEDLEFYHDQGGITLGKTDFLETTERIIVAGGTDHREIKLKNR